jgi:molybdopterin-binding protein
VEHLARQGAGNAKGRKGQTTAYVRLQRSGGAVGTAAITNEAVEQLQLAMEDQAAAVVEASDVMIGKD